MGSDTDKLFRDKLKGLEQSPPPQAWSRVEKSVRKSRGFRPWLNIAAALLILIMGIWNQWPDNSSETITENTIDTISVQPVPGQEIAKIEIAASEIISEEEKTQQPLSNNKKQLPKQIFHRDEINQANIASSTGQPVEIVDISATQTDQQNEIVNETSVDTHTGLHNSSTTILYSTDEVNSRFLKKPKTKKATTPTPSTETKPTTGQKISSIAVAIKNTEVGLGDLRQMKDELLAFDFRDNDHKNTQTQDK